MGRKIRWDDAWVHVHDGAGPVVCTKHRRFIPCRFKEGCTYSDLDEDVHAVREYQQSVIREANEERKS